jgi:hypothetical protein
MAMNEMNEENANLEREARQALEQARLSSAQSAALARARAAALSQHEASTGHWRSPWFGGMVAASLALFLFVLLPQNGQDVDENPAEAFVALSELDETDYLIVEDMDFAYWLVSETDTDAGTDHTDLGTDNG